MWIALQMTKVHVNISRIKQDEIIYKLENKIMVEKIYIIIPSTFVMEDIGPFWNLILL